MKTILLTILSIFVFSNVIWADTVKICDDGAEYPPYAYWKRINGEPDKSRLTGATVDLVKEIFTVIEMEYIIKLLPWKRCLNEVNHFGENKEYEVFIDGSYSEERAKKYYVSPTIFKTHQGIFYSKKKFADVPPINNPEDVNKFRLCGVLGNNYNPFYELGVKKQIDTGARDIHSALQKVSFDRCDFFLSSIEPIYGGVRVGQYKIPEDIVDMPFPGAKEPTFHIFVAKTSPRAYELHTKISQAILFLQYKGNAKKIFKKYLPGDDGL